MLLSHHRRAARTQARAKDSGTPRRRLRWLLAVVFALVLLAYAVAVARFGQWLADDISRAFKISPEVEASRNGR